MKLLFKLIVFFLILMSFNSFFFPPLTNEEKIKLTHKIMSANLFGMNAVICDGLQWNTDISRDAWGTILKQVHPMEFITGYVSAGPDKVFDTEDDLKSETAIGVIASER